MSSPAISDFSYVAPAIFLYSGPKMHQTATRLSCVTSAFFCENLGPVHRKIAGSHKTIQKPKDVEKRHKTFDPNCFSYACFYFCS